MPDETASACYCTALRDATRRITARYDDALAPLGVGAAQLALLRAVKRIGAPTITGLGRQLGLDRSTVGRNLRVLARKGLLRLGDDDEDMRASVVATTPEGEALLARADPLWADVQKTVKDRLGPEDTNRLLAMLSGL